MKVLIGCERSAVIRNAFLARGHDAYSCDVEPCDDERWPDRHFQCDVRDLLKREWDLFICHPECTFLCGSGWHWTSVYPGRIEQAQAAADFATELYYANVEGISRLALENPVGVLTRVLGKPNQYIQPYFFGHPESKKTGLWLRNLPCLEPTNILPMPACGYWDNQTPSRNNKVSGGKEQSRKRAKTYSGIAEAMAEQWGSLHY